MHHADDLGRAIACRQLLNVDLDEVHRLWRVLCPGTTGEKGDADHRCTSQNHGFS